MHTDTPSIAFLAGALLLAAYTAFHFGLFHGLI